MCNYRAYIDMVNPGDDVFVNLVETSCVDAVCNYRSYIVKLVETSCVDAVCNYRAYIDMVNPGNDVC